MQATRRERRLRGPSKIGQRWCQQSGHNAAWGLLPTRVASTPGKPSTFLARFELGRRGGMCASNRVEAIPVSGRRLVPP